MTNQLTYTDIDTNTVATPPSPASSISTCDIRRSGLRSGGGRRRSIALTGLGLVAVASIGAAAVAGALVGLEREMTGKAAGFRTNILIAVGAALATVVGVLIEVPVMLSVVKIVNETKDWYERA